jgi:hypothetical protein
VAAVAAASLALAAPTIGKARFDVANADKVDGYHAGQLNVVKYWSAAHQIDNFDICNWTPILKRSFKAPAEGTVTLQGEVTGETDFDFAFVTDFRTRLVVDGKVASQESELATETEGGIDRGNSPTVGGRHVSKGKHHVALQAEECSDDGVFYIKGRSIALQFSPFGSAEKVPQDAVTVKANPQQQ